MKKKTNKQKTTKKKKKNKRRRRRRRRGKKKKKSGGRERGQWGKQVGEEDVGGWKVQRRGEKGNAGLFQPTLPRTHKSA